MNAIDLQKEYDFLSKCDSEWINTLDIQHKAQIAIILNKYANKLNKPCVSSSFEGCLNIGLYDDCGRFIGWYCKDCGKFEKDI